MKRTTWIAVLAIVGLVSAWTLAQQQRSRGRQRSRPINMRKYMKYKLTMPTGLYEQLKDRLVDQAKLDASQIQPIEQLAQEYDEKMTQVRKEFVERFRELLTGEQRSEFRKVLKYDQYQQSPPQGVDRLKNNPRLFRITGRMFRFDDQLKEQIEMILKQYEAGLETLGEDDEEAKKQYSEQTFNQIMTLLTPEQQQQVMDFGKRGGAGRGTRRPGQP